MTNREPYQKCSHSPYQTMVLIHAHNELCVKKDLERFEQKSKGGLTQECKLVKILFSTLHHSLLGRLC